jgi:hypothetical protein
MSRIYRANATAQLGDHSVLSGSAGTADPHREELAPPRENPKPRVVRRRAKAHATPVRTPATATTIAQWASTWTEMCTDGDLVLGPLNDESLARTRYDLSARQLRNIRNAAMSAR